MAEKEKKKPDWAKIKAEYLANRTSYRKLAEKYSVSFSTLKERARREKWAEDAKATQEKVRTKLTQKLAEKKASILAQELDPALEATNLINQLVLDTLKDEKQFKRHLIQRKEKFDSGTEKWWVEEQEFDVVDTKRLRDLAQALKISKELQRLLQGLLDPEAEKRLQLEKERLELEKMKAGIGDGEDDETGIVILPEVKSVDQEQQQQEGAADE